MLNEFYRVAFRKKIYQSLDELQIRFGLVDKTVQPGQVPSGEMVLWEDSDADFHRQYSFG
jgi:hypothetical protein